MQQKIWMRDQVLLQGLPKLNLAAEDSVAGIL